MDEASHYQIVHWCGGLESRRGRSFPFLGWSFESLALCMSSHNSAHVYSYHSLRRTSFSPPRHHQLLLQYDRAGASTHDSWHFKDSTRVFEGPQRYMMRARPPRGGLDARSQDRLAPDSDPNHYQADNGMYTLCRKRVGHYRMYRHRYAGNYLLNEPVIRSMPPLHWVHERVWDTSFSIWV